MSVSNSLFGEIIIKDDSVSAVISEPFTHGATRVWSKVLKWGGVGGGGNDDDGVFHGASGFKSRNQLGNSRLFLSNGNVDAVTK